MAPASATNSRLPPPASSLASRAQEEVEQHAAGDPDREVDDGPLGGGGRPDPGRDVALVQHGQDQAEGHHRDQGVDAGGELEDRQERPSATRARSTSASTAAGELSVATAASVTACTAASGQPCAGEEAEERQQGRQRGGEGRDRLGEGDRAGDRVGSSASVGSRK